jgi:hypothetical protein
LGEHQRNLSTTNQPILSEGGLVITESHVAESGKTYSWGELGIVQIAKPRGLARLLTRQAFYELRVAKKGATTPETIFSTDDAALARRIEEAINTVARKRGASREL